jgi:retron-type reverse transcriptase
MRKQFLTTFGELISTENLLEAWREFLRGKRKRHDVQRYQMNLMDNIVALHSQLANKTYVHGSYFAFNISDPKPRNIHKASVNDRLLHHALYRHLYPFFSTKFIADSFSCQLNKGIHKALKRFREFFYKVSKNNTKSCRVLKCDIRKFFANVDHTILKNILRCYIADENILALLDNVISSFNAGPNRQGIGLPLGNLTSQLFVNIYMNEFDQFVKHKLKIKYYIRYCDDFVFFSSDQNELEELMPAIKKFLSQQLGLELHPDKVFIKTVSSGVDFLGWTHFHDHRALRTTTKKRMLKKLRQNPKPEPLNSYLGLLRHGNTEKLQQLVIKEYYLNRSTDNPNTEIKFL